MKKNKLLPLLARRGFMKHEFHGFIKLILNP